MAEVRTYRIVTIADDGIIQETEIEQNSLDDSEIEDNSLTALSLAPNSVQDSELMDGGPWTLTSNSSSKSPYIRSVQRKVFGVLGTVEPTNSPFSTR